ncbi:AraC family transcriptional regulator [Sediminibacillus halophilus]|uniref:AraC-type DNA-binding protein n=1 Tax=Sediminibacillus halophilus TaxID=482461 RepID=A0A1G9TAM5_9BACI|nr:AraC family transcriptional regulator [Sediminibacillus halophilus]SDM44694.1 AraC-type DNA-binding protein [Sediminibacillus halophilus]
MSKLKKNKNSHFIMKKLHLIYLSSNLPSYYFRDSKLADSYTCNKINASNPQIFSQIEKRIRNNTSHLNAQEIKLSNICFIVLPDPFSDKGMFVIGPYLRENNTETFGEKLNVECPIKLEYSFKISKLSKREVERYKQILYLGICSQQEEIANNKEILDDITLHQKITEEKELYYPHQQETEFLSLFKKGDKRCIKIFQEYRPSSLQYLNLFNIRYMKNNLMIFVSTLTQEAIEAGCNPQQMIKLRESFVKQIETKIYPKDQNHYIKHELRILSSYLTKVQQYLVKGHSKATRTAVSYIQDHLTDSITLKQIATYCGRHPSYISSLFKKEVGIPLQEYILGERLKKAKYFLKNSSYLLVDIAHYSGFESQSYFSFQFKRKNKCTPLEYRNKMIDNGY